MVSSLARVRVSERRGRRLAFLGMGFPRVGEGACGGSARGWEGVPETKAPPDLVCARPHGAHYTTQPVTSVVNGPRRMYARCPSAPSAWHPLCQRHTEKARSPLIVWSPSCHAAIGAWNAAFKGRLRC